eukprot:Em0022g171a
MPIVCERFTTSKLRKFEDLSKISTYGFRGEALASISHVAHVSITSRTADSKCAYKATYSDGKIVPLQQGGVAEPRPCAGNPGTQIVVEDLFYNVVTRRKALKNPSEEYNKIVDAVTRYAIHNSGVAFMLKKHGETIADVRTQETASVKENIGALYGASVSRELLPISSQNPKLGFSLEGFVTNANYSQKKFEFLLFINHRLVDSTALRKAIELVYGAYLPKNSHPYVYLSINIVPSNIDVNVHPTKHEVHFLHEDLIVEAVQKAVEEQLLNCATSRTYFTQTLLPGANIPAALPPEEDTGPSTSTKDKPSTYAYHMVRTDSREQTLDAFMVPRSLEQARGSGEGDEELIEEAGPSSEGVELAVDATMAEPRSEGGAEVGGLGKRKHTPESSESCVVTMEPFKRKLRRKEVKLNSVQHLQQLVRDGQHSGLSQIFQNHKFVGCVDQTRALMQHQTKLYLVDLAKVTPELFYQLTVFDFGNFGFLQLSSPAPIHELVMVALESKENGWRPEDGPKEKLAEFVVDLLKSKADMLKDYFSLEITQEGHVRSLPILLSSHTPNLDRLPDLLLHLATEVEWDTEEECFQTLAREFGLFYSIQYDPFLLEDSADKQGGTVDELHTHSQGSQQQNISPALCKRQPWRWLVEHVIFPALRTDFIPQSKMAEDGSVLQIADLHELYKVFERC